MDEFTERLLAEDKEREEHPERFRITRVCGECGKREDFTYPKAYVEEFVAKTGSNEVNGYCYNHGLEEDDE